MLLLLLPGRSRRSKTLRSHRAARYNNDVGVSEALSVAITVLEVEVYLYGKNVRTIGPQAAILLFVGNITKLKITSFQVL